jgi:hypothetical protein
MSFALYYIVRVIVGGILCGGGELEFGLSGRTAPAAAVASAAAAGVLQTLYVSRF